jgi:arylsulfatase A-like enzyme
MDGYLQRRDFLKAIGLAAATLNLPGWLLADEQDTGAKPNVVLIFADDLGYGEVSCYPQQQPIHTPNIDRLARSGILMSDGYSADGMCLPSRASLLTGRYHQRFRQARNIPETEQMIGHYLKQAGYVTGCVGKWHNTPAIGKWDGNRLNHPLGRGFDEFYGFLGGMHDYLDSDKGFQTGKGWIYMPVYAGAGPVEKAKYLTEEFTDRAVDFITRHKDRPFFLYLAYNAVHTPNQAPQKYLDRNNGDVHLAMIDTLDEGVGRVLDRLRKLGMYEDTLVLFIGDNGGSVGPNWKLRGRKGTFFEGGIRVPFIASWPAVLPKGHLYSSPVMHIDVLPTILGACGVKVPDNSDIDGTNLIPYWLGKTPGPPHKALFWGRTDGSRYAVRRGEWKLVRESDTRQGEPEPGLYNLRADGQERHNLLQDNRKVADELLRLYGNWSAQTAPKRGGRKTSGN